MACLSFIATAALAQSPNPTEELIRQQERERQIRQQFEKQADVHLPGTPLPLNELLPHQETPCFPIHRIELIGTDSEIFQWALAQAEVTEEGKPDPAQNTCLGTQGINLVMRRVQNAIIKRGYVTTRIFASPQDISTGPLHLTVVPGRIHRIHTQDDSIGTTSSRAYVGNALPAKPGDLLNLRDIEQALENLKRVPTAEADIQIVPAEGDNAQPGESDLIIRWKQSLPLRLTLSADDSGTQSTGRYQGGVTLSLDHPLALNDLFYLSLNQSLFNDKSEKGTRGYTGHYSLPLDYWLISTTTSKNTYHQTVAELNGPVRYRGTSDNSDVKLSRLVYRDAQRKTSLSLRGWFRESNNFVDDEEVIAQRRRMAGWEAGINHKEFIGEATLESNLSFKQGTRALGAIPAPEEVRAGDKTGTAQPRIATLDAQLNAPFKLGGQTLRYNASLRAQWNDTPLVPQDRFSIGGRYTVRGFDGELILSAERGWLIRNDLGWKPGDGGQEIYLGIDHGEVAGPSSERLLGKYLTGAVLGIRGNLERLSYDLFLGTPLAKPDGFKVPRTAAGFNLSLSF